jgi:malate dehydrogenase (oxaloacetate-decarboxylating)(NADP+)
MKLAATRALADLAREDVPESVMKAYGLKRLQFGPEYLIPKPFDPRVLIHEATAVARAAMETGVAGVQVDLDEYRERLERLLGMARHVMRMVINRARREPKRVVLAEGNHEKVLRAAQVILDEGFARPILLGDRVLIRSQAEELGLHLDGAEVIEPPDPERWEHYAQEYFRMRQRKGLILQDAREAMRNPMVWGSMMVHLGDADALVAGISQHYPDTLRPALRIVGHRPDVSRVASLFMMIVRDRVYFFADPTVIIDPTAEELADIAVMSAEVARRFDVEPRVAMLSFSNFGSVQHPQVAKVQEATRLVRERCPDLMVDGEMQADTAVVPELIEELYPFSNLEGGANVLVFPDLQSANVAFKLVQRLGGAEAVGPILMGMAKPVHLLQHGCEAKDIVYMSAIAAVDAQSNGVGPDAAPAPGPMEPEEELALS